MEPSTPVDSATELEGAPEDSSDKTSNDATSANSGANATAEGRGPEEVSADDANSNNSDFSKGFLQRANAKLSEIRNPKQGKFFQVNEARLMPSFDRSDSENANEIITGKKLGEGAFCEVREISAILLKRPISDESKDDQLETNNEKEKDDNDDNDSNPGQQKKGRRTSIKIHEEDESLFPVNLFQSKSEVRDYMSKNYLRDGDYGNSKQQQQQQQQQQHARYALKQLKPISNEDNNDVEPIKRLEQGLIDISIEAQFLACLNHPNIIKIRGYAGVPLSKSYGLILDRLYMTLEDKMDEWISIKKSGGGGVTCGCFKKIDPLEEEMLMFSAVTIAYDLSCAMRYIHSKNLVYRDLKPENAGFDVRGDIKIFDFGFCKELTKNLFDKPSGLYKLTRMTGSYPYMAPENFMGKPYGRSGDVFGFGVLLWEMISSKFAFYHLTKADYKEIVIQKKYRPNIVSSWPSKLCTVIKESWDDNPKKRPTFDRISTLLRTQHQELSMDESTTNRSQRMMEKSMRSIRFRRGLGSLSSL